MATNSWFAARLDSQGRIDRHREACPSLSVLSPCSFSPVPIAIPSRFVKPPLFRYGDERFPGPHGDRLRQVHPAAVTYGCRRQQAQPLAGARVDLEDAHLLSDLHAFQMEAGNDPVGGEAECEAPVFIKWPHLSTLLIPAAGSATPSLASTST